MPEGGAFFNWSGTGGAGKTVCLHTCAYALCRSAESRGVPHPKKFAKVYAPTGTAGRKAGGLTNHSGWKLPLMGYHHTDDLSDVRRGQLQAELLYTWFLLFDEKSMMGLNQVGAIDTRADDAFPDSVGRSEGLFDPFRDGRFAELPPRPELAEAPKRMGLRKFAAVVFIGDLGQLPPVFDSTWYAQDAKVTTRLARRGRGVLESIDFSVTLNENMRQAGADAFADLCWRAHEGEFIAADWPTLNQRALPYLPAGSAEPFSTALQLHARNKTATASNMRNFCEGVALGDRPGGIPRGALVKAVHNHVEGKKATSEVAGGLMSQMWYGVNAPMMLTTNLWTKGGLTNGLRGKLHDLVCIASPWAALPACVIMRVDHVYDDAAGEWRSPVSIPCCLPHLSAGENCTFVPIPAVERTWWSSGLKREITRKMIPLVMSWAITIHKAQGATLERVLLSVGADERHLGTFFTAISRVRALEHLALDEPMHQERLLKINRHKALPHRKRIV